MIIVFGSNVLDLFFNLKDLPPKDTALFMDTHYEQPGGKGANQAIAAARAGSEVRFFGALGDGGHGRQMFKNLSRNKVDVSGIEFLDMPSGLATIFVDESDGTHKVVVSQGANLKARQDSVPENLLNENTTLLLQGELPMNETEDLIQRAKAKGCRIVMNLAPVKELQEKTLQALDVIILNVHEADGLGAQLGMDTSDKEAYAKEMFEKYALTTVVTLGGDGAVTYTESGPMQISALKVTPVDMLGAGDAFCGYLTAGLDQGKSLEDSLKQASIAGALTCTQMGAQTSLPYAKDIDTHLSDVQLDKKVA